MRHRPRPLRQATCGGGVVPLRSLSARTIVLFSFAMLGRSAFTLALLVATAAACQPPDCNRQDCGTCGNACCRVEYTFQMSCAWPVNPTRTRPLTQFAPQRATSRMPCSMPSLVAGLTASTPCLSWLRAVTASPICGSTRLAAARCAAAIRCAPPRRRGTWAQVGVDFIGQAIHTTAVKHYNDTINWTVRSLNASEGAVVEVRDALPPVCRSWPGPPRRAHETCDGAGVLDLPDRRRLLRRWPKLQEPRRGCQGPWRRLQGARRLRLPRALRLGSPSPMHGRPTGHWSLPAASSARPSTAGSSPAGCSRSSYCLCCGDGAARTSWSVVNEPEVQGETLSFSLSHTHPTTPTHRHTRPCGAGDGPM